MTWHDMISNDTTAYHNTAQTFSNSSFTFTFTLLCCAEHKVLLATIILLEIAAFLQILLLLPMLMGSSKEISSAFLSVIERISFFSLFKFRRAWSTYWLMLASEWVVREISEGNRARRAGFRRLRLRVEADTNTALLARCSLKLTGRRRWGSKTLAWN